ncbi:MAG: hypothetical protein E7638_08765 [Ruminococcaceae bacterium]|nr:hypothetical protein [Oscillospiraceae bacterium]
MFIPFSSESIRYTGRFAEDCTNINDTPTMTATAPGSYFELAFRGDMCVLRFNIDFNTTPLPHLWIEVDGGAKVEVPLDRFIRLQAGEGEHTVKVTFKGVREIHHRWYHPLSGKVSFEGYDADAPGSLPEDNRKTIELVGDSITEGVLIDEDYRYFEEDQKNRQYQDDATATYAYLTAEALNLRPLNMGYGAVGVTRSGCGAVPKAAEAYPFCFDGAPVTYDHPDYILINHGANDRRGSEENYIREYKGLLDVVRSAHPTSKIICLSAFLGVFPTALKELINTYNREHNDNILFIDATLWVPPQPLHPARDGHRIIADKLTAILKKELSL